MKNMTSAEVREAFLDFFEEMGHKHVASSSLVPGNDPTLLFTNAGMVQFKDVFLGLDKRPYSRATTSQKCMRVSGKHNDLENVGPSNRHHTFFEMLGNFSFGDYFKSDAIRYAYDLLTKVYELPPDRLVYTVYENDDDAFHIWTEEIGIDPRRVARLGTKTNFWQMADTGPCGPTSEVHWDLHPEEGLDSIVPDLEADSERFLEIWNLVFMQYNRTQADPAHTGQWDEPLPAPGVDTGAGLERIVSIVQHTSANYETDLFMPIIRRVQQLTGHTDAERDADIVPYRVIADHMRAATFLIADGVRPGATGRDYVCRMVIRRAVRFGTRLGFEEPFLADVTDAVIDVMGGYYTDLEDVRDTIRRTITNEEIRFRRAMDRALAELEGMLVDFRQARQLPGDQNTAVSQAMQAVFAELAHAVDDPTRALNGLIAALQAGEAPADVLDRYIVNLSRVNKLPAEVLADLLDAIRHAYLTDDLRENLLDAITRFQFPGELAFRLHAEKGLPLEITRDIVQEMGIVIDEDGFRKAQAHHEAVSRGQDGGAFAEIDMGAVYRQTLAALQDQDLIPKGVHHEQYGPLRQETRLLAILRDGELIDRASVGDRVEAVLELTPFYVESGGQVSDRGVIEGEGWAIDIEDARQPIGGLIVHSGEVVEGQPAVGELCHAAVDAPRRLDITRNHTATHLLHAELRSVLGTHVQQRGSLVAPDRLRFDFSHEQAISQDELDSISQRINQAILANLPVFVEWNDLDSARAGGAMALFGEKYGEHVRTIIIGDKGYSYELCGGNHVENTGVIGMFVFTSEGSVAQGIRRIEALTGHGAEAYIRRSLARLHQVAGQLGTTTEALPVRVEALQTELKDQQHDNTRLRRRIARLEFESLIAQAEPVGDVTVLVARVNPTTADTLRDMADWFRDRVGSGIVVLGMVADNGRPQLLAAATKDLKQRFHAGNVIREAAKIVGGGGGGRPDMAQAGGKDPEQLDAALQHARELIAAALG
ncbi:MAG: alanine--tRNA ligase [Anaerolineae bacterium]|nr:alanine--tRNA ligase [Anaerolineae bacterium]